MLAILVILILIPSSYSDTSDDVDVRDKGYNQRRYAAIGFDAYGTLLDVVSVPEARAATLSLPPGFAAIWREKQLNYSWLRTIMNRYVDFWAVTEDALEYTLEFYNVTLTKKNRTYLLNSWYHLNPFPEVERALKDIKASYPNLYILSNGSPKMLEIVMKNSGLDKYFVKIISVDVVKKFKPSPRVYKLFQKIVHGRKRNILFVSSNSWDGHGAKSYGFTTAYINRNKTPSDVLGYPPDFTFSGLDQLQDTILAKN